MKKTDCEQGAADERFYKGGMTFVAAILLLIVAYFLGVLPGLLAGGVALLMLVSILVLNELGYIDEMSSMPRIMVDALIIHPTV